MITCTSDVTGFGTGLASRSDVSWTTDCCASSIEGNGSSSAGMTSDFLCFLLKASSAECGLSISSDFRLVLLTAGVVATLFFADNDFRADVDLLVLLSCNGVPSASGANTSSPSLALPRSNTLVSSTSSPSSCCGCALMREAWTLDLRLRTISSILPCRGRRLKFFSASMLVSTAGPGVPVVVLVFSRRIVRLVAAGRTGVGAALPLRSRAMVACNWLCKKWYSSRRVL